MRNAYNNPLNYNIPAKPAHRTFVQKFENPYSGVRIFCIKRKFDTAYDRSISFLLYFLRKGVKLHFYSLGTIFEENMRVSRGMQSLGSGFPIGARSIPVGTRFSFGKSSVLYLLRPPHFAEMHWKGAVPRQTVNFKWQQNGRIVWTERNTKRRIWHEQNPAVRVYVGSANGGARGI